MTHDVRICGISFCKKRAFRGHADNSAARNYELDLFVGKISRVTVNRVETTMTAQQLALRIIQNIEKAFPIEMCGIDGYPETLRLPYDRLAAFGQSFGRACFCSARQGIVVVPGKPRIQKRDFAQKLQRLLPEKVCVLECETGKLFGNGAYEIL